MFCSKCGKEVADEAQFCQFCGNKIDNKKETENISNQEENNLKKNKNKSYGIFIAIIISFIIIGLFNMNDNTSTSTTTETKKASCPSVSEMEDALRLYKEGKIIYSFTPELNTVKITPLAEKQLLADDIQTLGYITACYSGYIKGNNLNWAEIYSAKTNKKIAKFSESYGFKMY